MGVRVPPRFKAWHPCPCLLHTFSDPCLFCPPWHPCPCLLLAADPVTRVCYPRVTRVMMWRTVILPMSFVNLFVFLLVTEGRGVAGRAAHRAAVTGATSAFSQMVFSDCACVFGTNLLVLFDGYLNRQPVYACFHGLVGALACWAYLLFNIVFTVAGGTDGSGMPYIYRSTRWSDNRREAWMSVGKLTFLEVVVLLPIGNALYWCMLWARRRARVQAMYHARAVKLVRAPERIPVV